MATTIQISKNLREELMERKLFDSETYEEVIWDMIEDISELSEETKRAIKVSERDIKEGKTVSLEEVKKNLGM